MAGDDYLVNLGMEFNPFLKNSREIIIPNAEYNEAMLRLDYLSKTKGFGLLTGAPGRGKTTIIRKWAEKLNPSLYKVVYSSLSTLTVQEFYRSLASGLGAEPSFRKIDNFNIIQDEITRLTIEKKRTPVIIIDEANYIKSAVLNDMKMLFNFEMDSKDRAIILLAGLPQLNNTLNLASNEPLRQRIVMNYNVDGLTKEEGRAYISTKMKSSGTCQVSFDDAAIEALLNAADGTPRMINKYCSACLLIAGSKQLPFISADMVMQAVNECELVS